MANRDKKDARLKTAQEQSQAITQLDCICREAGLPTYSHLVITAEKATPMLLSSYIHTTQKTFAEIAEEYVCNMLNGEPADEQERRLR